MVVVVAESVAADAAAADVAEQDTERSSGTVVGRAPGTVLSAEGDSPVVHDSGRTGGSGDASGPQSVGTGAAGCRSGSGFVVAATDFASSVAGCMAETEKEGINVETEMLSI